MAIYGQRGDLTYLQSLKRMPRAKLISECARLRDKYEQMAEEDAETIKRLRRQIHEMTENVSSTSIDEGKE